MDSEHTKLERNSRRALEALELTQGDITAIRVCLAWLAANPSKAAIMSGDSTVFKMLLGLSERVESSHRRASQRLRASLPTDELPF